MDKFNKDCNPEKGIQIRVGKLVLIKFSLFFFFFIYFNKVYKKKTGVY